MRLGAGLALVASTVAGVAWAAPAGAAAPPVLRSDALQLDFGTVNIGAPLVGQTITYSNRGPGTATGLTTTASSGPFTRSSTTCGSSLAVGASCTATYTYTPSGLSPQTGNVFIRSAGGGAVRVKLTGQPNPPAFPVVVESSAFGFPPTALGAGAPVQTLVVRNGSASGVQFTVTGFFPGRPFTLVSTCGGGTSLAAGASCLIHYGFRPTRAGAQTATTNLTITLAGGAGARTTPITFSGHGGTEGAFPFVVTGNRQDFGSVAVGDSTAARTVRITNVSDRAQSNFIAAGMYHRSFPVVNPCPASLAPGASCNLQIGPVLPREGGLVVGTGIVNLTADRPESGRGINRDFPLEFAVTGTGGRPRISITPRRIDLGAAPIGGTTAVQTVTVRNTGNATAFNGDLQTGGLSSAFDLIANTCGPTLAAGASCTIKVNHNPVNAQPDVGIMALSYDGGEQRFFQFFGGPDRSVHRAFVDFAYRRLANVETGPSSSVAALDAGTTTRRAVASAAGNSDARAEKLVQELYVDTLGRFGDPGGTAYWVRQLVTGRRSVAQVAAEFYASNEYYRVLGGNTNASWVQDLYRKLLGREADAGGLSYWVGQTTSKGRVSVSGRFFQSIESRRARVDSLYLELLERRPDSAGRDYWAGQILTKGDIVLAIELASSTEFLYLAQYDD